MKTVEPGEVLTYCLLLFRGMREGRPTVKLDTLEVENLIAIHQVFLFWMGDAFLVLHDLANENWTQQSFDGMVRPEGVEVTYVKKFSSQPMLLRLSIFLVRLIS
jgi:hypothetical protein